MISIDYLNLNENIVIKVADTIEELEQAFRLVQESYSEINLADIKQSPLRVNKYHALPTTAIIILKKEDTVIATVSVITSNRYDLPLESLWNIDHIKNSGRTAEISSLAVHKEHRKAAGKYTIPLMIYMYKYSSKYMGIKNFVISINPKAAIFYRAMFNFKFVSKKIKRYEFVNNAPAICLHLQLDYWQEHVKKKEKFDTQLAQKMVQECNYFILPKTQYYCSLGKVMTPKLLDYFFLKKTSAIHDFKDEEIEFLKEVYNFKEYQHILKNEAIGEKKYFVYCHADLVIGSKVIDFDTFAVNDHKIFGKMYSCKNISIEGQCVLKIDISRKESIILKGIIKKEDEYYVINIEKHNEWHKFLDYIKTKFYFNDNIAQLTNSDKVA